MWLDVGLTLLWKALRLKTTSSVAASPPLDFDILMRLRHPLPFFLERCRDVSQQVSSLVRAPPPRACCHVRASRLALLTLALVLSLD
jgi:hypothetical protein